MEKLAKLSPEQEHYPYLSFTPVLALRDLIDRGWDPEWEFKGPNAREFREPTRSPTMTSAKRPASFFLYFKNAADAERARLEIVRQKRIFTTAQIEDVENEAARNENLLKQAGSDGRRSAVAP